MSLHNNISERTTIKNRYLLLTREQQIKCWHISVYFFIVVLSGILLCRLSLLYISYIIYTVKSWLKSYYNALSCFYSGHVIAEAISSRFITAVTGAQSLSRSCGIFGGQSCNGARFLLANTNPFWELQHDTKYQDEGYGLHLVLLMSLQRIRPGQRPILTFHKKLIFYGEMFAPRPAPSWSTTLCRLSASANSIHSQLPSISGGHLLHPQPGDAPCRGDKGPT
jgi:hypothetical protein